MTYGQRPEGMSDPEWMLETQARMVVREMRTLPRQARRTVFDKWQKLPGVTHDRVQRIWKEGSDQ